MLSSIQIINTGTFQAPAHSGSTFFNYKGYHSIILMAICDANYNFIMVDVGASGRHSDGGVFKNSVLGQKFHNQTMNVPGARVLEDNEISLPFVLVADEAFQLTNFMMRPFPGRNNLTNSQKIFNYRLSRARRYIENSFGILASRWRIYRKPISAKVETIEFMILATVCLHNFIMKRSSNNYCPQSFVDVEDGNGYIRLGAWRNEGHLEPATNLGSNTNSRSAYTIRNNFMNYFENTGAVSWQQSYIDNGITF